MRLFIFKLEWNCNLIVFKNILCNCNTFNSFMTYVCRCNCKRNCVNSHIKMPDGSCISKYEYVHVHIYQIKIDLQYFDIRWFLLSVRTVTVIVYLLLSFQSCTDWLYVQLCTYFHLLLSHVGWLYYYYQIWFYAPEFKIKDESATEQPLIWQFYNSNCVKLKKRVIINWIRKNENVNLKL